MKGGVHKDSSEEKGEARISHRLPNSAQGATQIGPVLRIPSPPSLHFRSSFWLLTSDWD